jgi:hypothetical protein
MTKPDFRKRDDHGLKAIFLALGGMMVESTPNFT